MWYAKKRVSDHGSPMKLRLLSWNVGGANDSSKRKGALDASGSVGGILICWDKRTLDVLELEGVTSMLSSRKRERSRRGRLIGAMRRNNQSWARLDRFLVTQNWLDQFSGVFQSRLPRPTSDHFSILLEGGGLRRGPSPFRNPLETIVQGALVKGRDKNIGFFHRMANAHRRNNSLDRIKINKVWLTEEQEVREGIVNAFQQLLSEEPGWRVDIGGLHLHRLSFQEAENLELPFSEEEIHFALLEMNSDKALGSDGFTVAFWQACWDFVKEEILELFKEFYDQSSFTKSLNATFLVLIPKKGVAEDLGDFRPISLLGGLYKLLAKVLANRLKKVLGRVVSVDQNAFVRGRQILDASLITNGVIDSWQKRKEKGLISGFFSSTKGLRQGDSLSPYLFVLGMEVLSALIRRAADGGFISGCRFRGRGRMEINVASGLRINLAKSELIPVGEVEEIEEMAVELGCRVGSLPNVYLGLPFGAHHKAPSMWDGVEERMRRRLALWKRQYISKGGRITLIKSTLASMPIYQLSLFRMPKIVARRLEKLQRDFLWGGGSLERKVHLIKWEVVCAQKEKGGLGIRKIVLLNKALLENGYGDLSLKRTIFGRRISSEEDSVFWKGGGSGIFGVKDAYNLLVAPNDFAFPKKCIWVDKACSGLRINSEKSEMIPMGRVHNIEGLALELGCKVGGIPSCYLGMPLGAAFNSLAVWDGVEERFRRRLAMWKIKVRLRLEKIQRDFLWGGGALAQKPHLVRWNLVCLEKRKGGLGVRNLALMNSAFLCKWNWRFANEREALWRRVISLKYDEEEGGWRTRDVMGRNGVGLWKNAWVSEVWNPVGDGDGWTTLFARAFNDWEIDLVERLLQKIHAFRVQREEEDRVI
ncbi:putative ribonuclease H protein [Vitis vinifera]|uniref:Putative ribonuclease H protein n=1 Tax=Vitis vinifera TaxID=29760 RepID=A0A438D6V1_VITVI|nr:putative ribonuclease H protein [Vitis vinifera]